MDGDQIQRRELGGIRLGRRDGDFRPRPSVDHAVRLTRNGGTDDVDHRQRPHAALLAQAQRGQTVGRFAALADDDHQPAFLQNRVAVAEFARQIDLAGDTRRLFKDIARRHADVIRRTAADEIHAGDGGEILVRQPGFAQVDIPFAALVFLDARGERVAHGARLLVDLLHHKMLVAVLFGGGGVPLDLHKRLFDFLAVDVIDVQLVAGEAGDFLIVDVDDAARVIQHGGHVGGDHVPLILAVTAPKDQRAVLAGGVNHAGLVAEENPQRIAAAHADHHVANRVERAGAGIALPLGRLGIIAVQQRGGDLGIRLRGERVALFEQGFLELLIVFDDAVVHDHHALFAGILRMRVDGARLAVGRPAGVADAAEAVHGVAGIGHLHQVFEAAFGLDDLDMFVGLVAHGQTGRVIAAVFEL